MRVPWKLLGVAGLAGVAATGVMVVRRRRSQTDYDPEELRDRLHRRLSEAKDPLSAPPEPERRSGGVE